MKEAKDKKEREREREKESLNLVLCDHSCVRSCYEWVLFSRFKWMRIMDL